MKAPIQRIKKEGTFGLIWLQSHYCDHGHDFLSHYTCFLNAHPDEERIGFFDIETTGLKGNYDQMLCYAIKHKGGIIYQERTKKEIKTGSDKEITRKCVEDLQAFDKIVTYYGCLTAGHKILKSNLQWCNVEEIKNGDEIVSFDENNFDKWHQRHFRKGIVLNNVPIMKEVATISLSDGTSIEATLDHPFLVKRGGLWSWKTTKQLIHFNGDNTMQRVLPVWKTNDSYHARYIAAFFDGEGCVSQVHKNRGGQDDNTFSISFSQKDERIIQKLRVSMDFFKFRYVVSRYDKEERGLSRITVLGSKAEKIRFLGIIQCSKISRVKIDSLGELQEYEELKIKSIVPSGIKTVYGIETSTKTYISDGFCSHNTNFDIPFVRTRALWNGLDFPKFGEIVHQDAYFLAKNKLCMQGKKLGLVCSLLFGETNKTEIYPMCLKQVYIGDKKAMKYLEEHNRGDVIDLERVYYKLKDFQKSASRSL